MNDQARKIRRVVMRRVYRAYALGVLLHPALLSGAAFGGSLVLFVHIVSVPDIVKNLLGLEVAAVPGFLLNAFLRGEVLTLLTLGVMVMSVLSVRWRAKLPIFRVPVSL